MVASLGAAIAYACDCGQVYGYRARGPIMADLDALREVCQLIQRHSSACPFAEAAAHNIKV